MTNGALLNGLRLFRLRMRTTATTTTGRSNFVCWGCQCKYVGSSDPIGTAAAVLAFPWWLGSIQCCASVTPPYPSSVVNDGNNFLDRKGFTGYFPLTTGDSFSASMCSLRCWCLVRFARVWDTICVCGPGAAASMIAGDVNSTIASNLVNG